MKFGHFYLALPLHETPPGGGPAAPSPTPAAPVAAPTGGNPSTPAPSAPVAPPTPPAFTYKEDRSNWVPSHVVRQRTQEAERFKQELEYERRRVAALSGVSMPATPDPESDAVRQQFAKLYPGLAKLEAMADKLEKAGNFDYDGIQSSQQQVWVAHGNQALATLGEKVKAAYGGADVPPKALQRISRAFVNEVSEDPEMKARYEAGDLSIIDEFVKDFTSGILDPYRRSTTAAAAPRNDLARRLPRGGGSSAIVGARPATLKPGDANFHNAAFARFNADQ